MLDGILVEWLLFLPFVCSIDHDLVGLLESAELYFQFFQFDLNLIKSAISIWDLPHRYDFVIEHFVQVGDLFFAVEFWLWGAILWHR